MNATYNPNRTSRERLAVIEQVVCDLHVRLYGEDGHGGDIAGMTSRLGRAEERIDDLRQVKVYVTGAIIAISAAATALWRAGFKLTH